MQGVTEGVGSCQLCPIHIPECDDREKLRFLPTFFTLDVFPPCFGDTGPPAGCEICTGMSQTFTQAAEILSEPQSRIPGLPLSVDPLPAEQAVPSLSLINPSENSSSDRLEQQNPHEPAEAEPGEGKLCAHKLTSSWGHSDSTAEATTVALTQLCPGCIRLSQTFPRHSSGAQGLFLKGHLGAKSCFLEPKDFGAGSWLEAMLPLAWKS